MKRLDIKVYPNRDWSQWFVRWSDCEPVGPFFDRIEAEKYAAAVKGVSR